jgi:small subunit ribosomal protein S16
MVIIRLSRVGKKKQPAYRLIVSDKSKDTQGKYLEILGNYNPRANPPTFTVKADRVKYWLDRGAGLSDTVHNLFVEKKIIESAKKKIWTIPKAKEEPKSAAPKS